MMKLPDTLHCWARGLIGLVLTLLGLSGTIRFPRQQSLRWPLQLPDSGRLLSCSQPEPMTALFGRFGARYGQKVGVNSLSGS